MAPVFLILLIAATFFFYAQNAAPALVLFLIWEFEISIGTVAVVGMLAGVVLAQLLGMLRSKQKADAKKTQIF